jgi:DNA repair exonuclease SbcCD nuclease subunit
MRFLHTADWQIGMKAVHIGEGAESVRRARFESARKSIETANSRGVDFVVLAGDTFEHHGIARGKVRETANLLSGAGCPVYVIPGNHDPAVAGSVWEDECWGRLRDVHVLLAPEPVAVPGGTLYPCPAPGKTSVSDPTAWIPAAPRDGIRIGLAHGTVPGNPEIDPSFPIARDAAERLGLDYLALGHHHSTAIYPDGRGAGRMAYSGAQEPTKFQERDSGNVLVVEIAHPGAAPVIEKVRTRVLDWRTVERTVESEADLAQLAAELEAIADPEHTLLDCVVSGEVPDGGDDSVQRLEEMVLNRFLFGRFRRDGLTLAASGDQWLETLPEGYLRGTALRLRQESQSSGDPAAEALRLFRRLWREVRA